MRRISIRFTMFLFVLLIALTALGLVLHTGIEGHNDEMNQIRLNSARLAFSISSEFRVLVNSAQELGETLALLPDVQNRNTEVIEPLLAKFIAKNPVYANIVLIDHAGVPWASGIPLHGQKYSMSDRRYFKDVMATGQFSAGEYTMGKTTSKPVLSFGYPLIDTNETLSGCIAIGFNLDYFRTIFDHSVLHAKATFLLLDHQGIILYTTASPEIFTGKPYPFADEFKSIQEGVMEKTSTSTDIEGLPKIITSSKLILRPGEAPYLYIVATVPYESFFTHLRLEVIGKLTVMVSLMLLVIVFMWYIGRRFILNPINTLTEAIMQIAGGNLTVRTAGHVNVRELEKVGQALDAMAIQLSKNITERKQAEDEVERINRIFSAILENAGTLVSMMDVNQNFVFWNKGAEIITGYAAEEVLGGKGVLETIYPDETYRQEIVAIWQEIIQGKPVDDLQLEVRTKNGEIKVISFYARGILDENGIPAGMVNIGVDITERQRAENALIGAESKFRNLLEEIHLLAVILDINGNITFCNDSLLNLTGWKKFEIIGKNWFELFIPHDFLEDAKSVFKENQSTLQLKHFENDILMKDGNRRLIAWDNTTLHSPDGDIIGIASIGTDLTEHRKTEEQLRQSLKMESVGRLAGGVAHDFNNMLGVILGHAEMVLDELDPNMPIYEDLVEIRKAAERSADLTRQLLAFARKQTVIPKILDLNDTVDGMLKLLRRLIGEDIDLVWLPENSPCQVKIDPSQVDQIMANLSINARDAITGIGKITIETKSVSFDDAYCAANLEYVPGDYVLLTISDDGCGMDKRTLDNLFEPFFTTKEVGKGTGLGLATVYGIVKQNNGFITVYSEPGIGTSFKIYLPRYHGRSEQLQEYPAAGPARGNETILLVEDEPMILAMTTTMLERLGYQVLAASTPGEAKDLAEKHTGKIHLLMTDVIMPEMNGRDLGKHLVTLSPHLRVLFMSGYTANVIAQHDILEEGAAFIQKPFSKKELALKLRTVLDR